jgi:flagellin
VDVASESANLAKLNILQQAGTAMLAQANMSTQSILRLIS